MLKTPLGYNIAVQELIPSDFEQVVVIASATGVVKEYYKHFAQYLFEMGIAVITFDYAGIGESRPISLRNFNTSAQKWATNDLSTVIDFALQKYPYKTLVLIGHSIGGQLIGLCPNALNAKKIILVAAQSGYYKLWRKSEQLKMLVAWKMLFPFFNFLLGYVPTKKFSAIEDLPGGMAMEWRNWCLSPNYLFDFVGGEDLYFDKIEAEMVSYSTDNDKFASVEATDWISDKYLNSKMKRIHLKPEDFSVKNIGHFGYFQKRCSHSVWPELLDKIRR